MSNDTHSQATDAIVDKIHKLLSMTTENGCTESEAANAALLAEKLLTQHKLSMDDVLKAAFKNGEVKAVQERCDKPGVSTGWAQGIALAVAKLCYAKAYLAGGTFAFVGFPEDVAVARRMMEHFQTHANATMNQYRDADWKSFKVKSPGVRYNGHKVASEFLTGYGMAVSKRLKERITEREAQELKENLEKLSGVVGMGDEPSSAPSTTTSELVTFSRDAISEWEKEQVQEYKFGKAKQPTLTVGQATQGGYKAGMTAPLDKQGAIA